MENFNIWNAYGLIIFLLYLFLGVFYLYYTSTHLMKRKGYQDEYISFLKKDIRKRVIGIAIAIPLIILLAGIFTQIIFGRFRIDDGPQMLVFFGFFFIMILPFPIIDNKKTREKYKKLAQDTGSEIVLDFNFKQLHKIFNPMYEIPATILYVIYMFILVKDFHVAFLAVMILWILYFTVRSARYMVRASMRDAYIYTFIFMFINQALLIFYLFREILIIEHPLVQFYFGLALVLFLTLKLINYIIGYISVKRELKKPL